MDPSAPSQGRAVSAGSGGQSAASSSASSASVPPPPERTPSQSSLHRSSHAPAAHRQSFAENLRNPPPSPRSQRHPSLTQQAIQELLNHPPPNKQPNPRFAGRDWRDVAIGELVSEDDDVKWVDMDTSVEEATMVLRRPSPEVPAYRPLLWPTLTLHCRSSSGAVRRTSS